MSWSQIKQQSRIAAEARLRDDVMAWRISREPWLEPRFRGDLRREFHRRRAAIEAAERAAGARRPARGISLRQLEAAFGQIERKYKMPDGTFVDADEWDREHGRVKGEPGGDSEHARGRPSGDDDEVQRRDEERD